MQYSEKTVLKNGKICEIRNAEGIDGDAVYNVFIATHSETDFLLSYPDENSLTPEQESEFLDKQSKSDNSIELCAVIDGVIAGTAGINPLGTKYKVQHRAEFGIGILKEYWGMGIGKALTAACISCAEKAGYTQLELEVVADNERAIQLYSGLGFREYGRNPYGFRSRFSGMQELVLMRLILNNR